LFAGTQPAAHPLSYARGVPGPGTAGRAVLCLVMMGARPILPDIGLEATPEMVTEAVLELAVERVSGRKELPGA
jgi:hypothetical protein